MTPRRKSKLAPRKNDRSGSVLSGSSPFRLYSFPTSKGAAEILLKDMDALSVGADGQSICNDWKSSV